MVSPPSNCMRRRDSHSLSTERSRWSPTSHRLERCTLYRPWWPPWTIFNRRQRALVGIKAMERQFSVSEQRHNIVQVVRRDRVKRSQDRPMHGDGACSIITTCVGIGQGCSHIFDGMTWHCETWLNVCKVTTVMHMVVASVAVPRAR